MKTLLAFTILVAIISCNLPKQGSESSKFSIEEANQFLDSLHKVNPERWSTAAQLMPDSVFKSQQSLDVTLTTAEFETIQKEAKDGKLNLKLFNKFSVNDKLKKEQISDGSVWVKIYPFKNPDQFALEVYTLGWECDVYFFDRNKVVAKHHIYHRYGLEIESFTNESNETVIYYKQNFTSGTGVWWWDYNFFKYTDHQLIPVLNVLQNANLANPNQYRMLWLETSIAKTAPLTLKMVYHTEIPQARGYESDTIENDSTLVEYHWNSANRTYEADFSKSKLSQNKIRSYYLQENELLFVHTHYEIFKKLVNGKDEQKRDAALKYLEEVKKNEAHLNEIEGWIR